MQTSLKRCAAHEQSHALCPWKQPCSRALSQAPPRPRRAPRPGADHRERLLRVRFLPPQPVIVCPQPPTSILSPPSFCHRSTDAGRQHFADQLTSIRQAAPPPHALPGASHLTTRPRCRYCVQETCNFDVLYAYLTCGNVRPRIQLHWDNRAHTPTHLPTRALTRVCLPGLLCCDASTTSIMIGQKTCAQSATSSRRCSTRSACTACARRSRWDSTRPWRSGAQTAPLRAHLSHPHSIR